MLQITEAGRALIRAALGAADARQREARRQAKAQKKRRMPRERFDAVLDLVLQIMKDWKTSKFEFEGPCRNGLRSMLCSEGWSFSDAEDTAGEIVAKALAIMGAVRPTYQEGQPEFGDNSLTIRTRCGHQGCGRPIPDERMNNGWTKYCSKECNAAATFHRAQIAGERMSRAEWKAKLAARRMSVCPTCENPFHAGKRGQIFCSHTCFTNDRREVHEAACKNCGKTWRPTKSKISTFCSVACTNDYREKQKSRIECAGCSKVFVGRPSSKYCSKGCFGAAQKIEIPEVSCAACSTIFRPRNLWKPRRFCSQPCAVTGRRSRALADFLKCEEIL